MNDNEHFWDLFPCKVGVGYKQFSIIFTDLGQFAIELKQNSCEINFW